MTLWKQSDPVHGKKKYEPNFYVANGSSKFLNSTHEELVQITADVKGKLARSDYWKLYEMGYCSRGPILEIGRSHGLSTTCIAMGARAAGHGHKVFSIDTNWRTSQTAEENLTNHGVVDDVVMIVGDSSRQLRNLPIVFDVAFIDGDHSYEGVCRDMSALQSRMAPGGAVLFHDYYHAGDGNPGMEVSRAVKEWAPRLGLEFRDGQGAIALYEQTWST